MFVPEASRWLFSRSQLEQSGTTSRAITQHVRRGRLHRVDHAWYVDGASWREWSGEDRHLVRVIAAHRRRGTSDCVFSHHSAAVLWHLPLARVEPARVHVSGATTNGHVQHGGPALARHEVVVAEDAVVERDGIRCTSLERTVADLLRCSAEETGIAALDAALRAIAWDDERRRYDEDRAAQFLADVAGRLPFGGRGVRRARSILAIGDGRAQLPGESISRLYLLRLGFARPRLQVPIPGPDGRSFYVDFGLDDAGVWGEFDGRAKYEDPALRRAGWEPREVLWAEKQREDWIRGATGRRLVRWSGSDIRDAEALGARLAAFRVSPRR